VSACRSSPSTRAASGDQGRHRRLPSASSSPAPWSAGSRNWLDRRIAGALGRPPSPSPSTPSACPDWPSRRDVPGDAIQTGCRSGGPTVARGRRGGVPRGVVGRRPPSERALTAAGATRPPVGGPRSRPATTPRPGGSTRGSIPGAGPRATRCRSRTRRQGVDQHSDFRADPWAPGRSAVYTCGMCTERTAARSGIRRLKGNRGHRWSRPRQAAACSGRLRGTRPGALAVGARRSSTRPATGEAWLARSRATSAPGSTPRRCRSRLFRRSEILPADVDASMRTSHRCRAPVTSTRRRCRDPPQSSSIHRAPAARRVRWQPLGGPSNPPPRSCARSRPIAYDWLLVPRSACSRRRRATVRPRVGPREARIDAWLTTAWKFTGASGCRRRGAGSRRRWRGSSRLGRPPSQRSTGGSAPVLVSRSELEAVPLDAMPAPSFQPMARIRRCARPRARWAPSTPGWAA
jgi:hypothetical protein